MEICLFEYEISFYISCMCFVDFFFFFYMHFYEINTVYVYVSYCTM